MRVLLWCDRVLRRSRDPEQAVQFNYQRNEATISDHRTISVAFKVMVRKKLEMGMGMEMAGTLIYVAKLFCCWRHVEIGSLYY
ncbi:hypothetical protein EDC04DRAFT_2768139 [Pisolithus marmoratus]|nr:hypothetical protein EDC04DRAFT_2768139 [Pisolithus marmoratus]